MYTCSKATVQRPVVKRSQGCRYHHFQIVAKKKDRTKVACVTDTRMKRRTKTYKDTDNFLLSR
jgi:hypothetical protein